MLNLAWVGPSTNLDYKEGIHGMICPNQSHIKIGIHPPMGSRRLIKQKWLITKNLNLAWKHGKKRNSLA